MFSSRQHYFVTATIVPRRLRSGGGGFDNDPHDLRLELSEVKVVQLVWQRTGPAETIG
jgi:hypothetical protein